MDFISNFITNINPELTSNVQGIMVAFAVGAWIVVSAQSNSKRKADRQKYENTTK
jgi:hypothetical protein